MSDQTGDELGHRAFLAGMAQPVMWLVTIVAWPVLVMGGGMALLLAYAKVFRVWLDDSTPGLDRTMAALDRKLRSAEEMMASIESACERVCRIACGFMPRGWGRREGEKAGPGSAGTSSASPAGG